MNELVMLATNINFNHSIKMENTEDIEFGLLSTTSNAQRRKELEKWFEEVKYGDYPNTLHIMLEDSKVKALLDDRYSHL